MTAVVEPRFDDIVHARHRLQICALLSDVDAVSFATAQEALGVNDYVVSKHVKVLVEAGYVQTTKTRDLGRPQTWLRLTPAGKAAFDGHLAALREMTAGH